MKSFLKFGFTALGLVLILLGVASLLTYTQLDKIGKYAIENVLDKSFSGGGSVENVTVSPFDQSIDIIGLKLANPDTFKDGEAVECGRVHIEFDPKTVFARPPVIQRVVVEDAEVSYRYEVGEGTNIGALAKEAQASILKSFTFLVRELDCKGVKVHFNTNLLPMARVGVDLINIHMDDLSKDEPVRTVDVLSLIHI